MRTVICSLTHADADAFWATTVANLGAEQPNAAASRTPSKAHLANGGAV